LTQLLGSWHHLIAYLSKQLDTVSWGWLSCLCALAATTVLVAEADKLTLGQELIVRVLHSVLTLMEYKENYWLTNSWMVKYQSMLCENPHVRLAVVKTVNLDTLFFRPMRTWLFKRSCMRCPPVGQTWSTSHLDVEYFTDGHSFVRDGTHFTEYTVVDSGCCHWSMTTTSQDL
jgi:hypothetical protein